VEKVGYYPRIFTEEKRKARRNLSQDKRWSDRYYIRIFPSYKSREILPPSLGGGHKGFDETCCLQF